MPLSQSEIPHVRALLTGRREELARRVAEIHAHARNPLEADAEEQAAQLGNLEVVSAIEGEATRELAAIDAALLRLEGGRYGDCVTCGEPIDAARLAARPASAQCLKCAEAAGA